MGHPLVEATLELYKNVQASFLPTPLKCHYMFNLRDFAKVIQGKVVSSYLTHAIITLLQLLTALLKKIRVN